MREPWIMASQTIALASASHSAGFWTQLRKHMLKGTTSPLTRRRTLCRSAEQRRLTGGRQVISHEIRANLIVSVRLRQEKDHEISCHCAGSWCFGRLRHYRRIGPSILTSSAWQREWLPRRSSEDETHSLISQPETIANLILKVAGLIQVAEQRVPYMNEHPLVLRQFGQCRRKHRGYPDVRQGHHRAAGGRSV